MLADSHQPEPALTSAIAGELGARVVQIGSAASATSQPGRGAFTHDWIFSLDADERCTPEARDEILACLADPRAGAYYIPRRNFFMGRWMRHSGFYPDYRQPQLFRKGRARLQDDDPVHEEYRIVSDRPVAYLRQPIWQFPFRNLEEVVHKPAVLLARRPPSPSAAAPAP